MQIDQHSFEMGLLSTWLCLNLTEDQKAKFEREMPETSKQLRISGEALTISQKSQVLSEIQCGNKIMAIKLVRQYTGWGLDKAKQYVENL